MNSANNIHVFQLSGLLNEDNIRDAPFVKVWKPCTVTPLPASGLSDGQKSHGPDEIDFCSGHPKEASEDWERKPYRPGLPKRQRMITPDQIMVLLQLPQLKSIIMRSLDPNLGTNHLDIFSTCRNYPMFRIQLVAYGQRPGVLHDRNHPWGIAMGKFDGGWGCCDSKLKHNLWI